VILCPDDLHAMQEWMADIRPLIRGEAAGGDVKEKKGRRKSVSKNADGRSYETGEDGKNSHGLEGAAVIKKGWLEKRGEINTAWKNRYFVLTAEDAVNDVPKMLRYFKDEESYRMLRNGGSIEIDEQVKVSKGSMLDPDHPHYFELATVGRTYALCAPKAEELEEWIAHLGGDGGERETNSTERRDSSASMASFATGPLNEVHNGWMKKKGQGMAVFGGKMQRRYFVLYDNRELHYFEGNSMDSISRKGRIRMAQATELARLKPDDKKDFTFIIKVPGRDWVLDPGSQAAWEEWERKLRPMLE